MAKVGDRVSVEWDSMRFGARAPNGDCCPEICNGTPKFVVRGGDGEDPDLMPFATEQEREGDVQEGMVQALSVKPRAKRRNNSVQRVCALCAEEKDISWQFLRYCGRSRAS